MLLWSYLSVTQVLVIVYSFTTGDKTILTQCFPCS